MLLIIQVTIGVALGIFIAFVIKSNIDKLRNINYLKYLSYFLGGCFVIGNLIYIDSFTQVSPLWMSVINNPNSSIFDYIGPTLGTFLAMVIMPIILGTHVMYIFDIYKSHSLHHEYIMGIIFLYGLLNIDVFLILRTLLLQSEITNNTDTAGSYVVLIYIAALIYRKVKKK